MAARFLGPPLGARYALVVSMETDRTEVGIWTPVAQMVGILVEV